ncbi:MAG TPA: ABC transporter ATP-binding protein [Candidatus Paceibacterota bacterium]
MSKTSFLKRVLFFFKPFWGSFAVVAALMLVGQLLNAFSPLLFSKGVDAVISGNARYTAYFLLAAFGAAFFRDQIIAYIREQVEIKKLDFAIEKAFSVLSMKRMFDFSIGQHINEHSGVKQTVVNKGQNSLSGMMFLTLNNILPSVLQIFAMTIFLLYFDWRVALTSTFFATLYIVLSYRRNIQFFPKVEQVRKNNQQQSKLQSELFRNSTLVIAEAQEKRTADSFKNDYDKVTDFSMSTWSKYINTFYLHRIIITVGQYSTLGLGTYYILNGAHSVGTFVALYSWTSAVFGNLMSIMNSQRQVLFQVVEIKKYFELLDIAPDIDPNIGGKTILELRGEIQFKNVSFAYPYRKSAKEIEDESTEEKEQEHTITDINFTIPAGAKVGFVGVSGSGKSTIVNLMRRYYEATGGEILIDGVPLKELDLRWLRSQIGNVEQKIELFDRSIRDNILFGLPTNSDIDDERLNKAISDASLDEFIAKLKDHGLDTVIGEGGVKVSGGERQRIGIARALIKDPKILIFDEATSALDSINEKLIHDAINKSAEGRTTIIIAHRLSTVVDADIIFVVKEGKIVDQGTHKELEKNSAEYQRLIKNQVLMA